MQRAIQPTVKQASLKSVLARVPGWAKLRTLKTKPLGGLTNRNYLVSTARSGKFVLRISRPNVELLGIDRKAELAALTAAAEIGIGPEVVHFLLPEGHLVTRYISGKPWPVETYRQPANLRQVVKTVKRVHELPAFPGAFSPFRRVESYADLVKAAGIPFPEDFDEFLEKMRKVEARQQADDSTWLKPCHNDLYSMNMLADGEIRLLDWEFAGMGDLYFDLAELVYSYDNIGPLDFELEEFLLECYFRTVKKSHRTRLRDMEFMVNLFSAMWGLVNHAQVIQGSLPKAKGFDYLEFAQSIFNGPLQILLPDDSTQRRLFDGMEVLG
ncbi:MAG TPA: choline kinase family protein [Anaerolineales bacterium]|nr:choline kinase family protein [Anaerolineales bacterium]